MFDRLILQSLIKWKNSKGRKPLVLRGARQVGKTTVVDQFAREFEQYIYLNLELPVDRQPFSQFTDMDTLVQSLFFLKNKKFSKRQSTLIFIDEIQELPKAMSLLRYFYEQAGDLFVMAAGSLLETIFTTNLSFPVGRVEYLVLGPVSFVEFLNALSETAALEQLQHIPLLPFAQDKLMRLFHQYALTGGMPEIVQHYAQNRDLTALAPVYESLIVSYLDDVEKYAKNNNQKQIIRHVIRASFTEAGKRIKFQRFGHSNYNSREISEALRTLEKAFFLKLIYPNTNATLPLMANARKSPRLQVLDTGMLNYFLGIQKEIIRSKDLNAVYQGIMLEHLVGQELLTLSDIILYNLHFWVREKKTSMAEVDYILPYDGKLIPVEVKSGNEGTLRSLHLFMDMAPHHLAVRLYAGRLNITTARTQNGKKYFLLNMPYFLVSQLNNYLNWFKLKVGD